MLNYEFPPLGGGAGNATLYLLKEFANQNNLHIDLITSSTDEYKEESFSANITIYFLDICKKGGLHHQSSRDLLIYAHRAYTLGKKLKKKYSYDLIHAFFGVPCGYVAMKLDLPYIVSLRGSDVPGHNPKFDKVYKILRGSIRKTWQKAARVVANSEDLKVTALKTNPNQPIDIIVNGVDTQKFKPAESDRSDDKFRVLYVGRMHEVKGVPYLLKAFEKFSAGKTNVGLQLIGEGPLYQEFLEKYKNSDAIHFPGRKDQSELIGIYRKADVFVLPSLNEGMSNTLLEAMASGLSIVATDTGGAKNLIQGNGVIVEKKSSNDLYEALGKLYDNRALLTEMKNKSRQLAEAMNWNKVAEQYLRIYKDLCAESTA